MPDKKSPHKIKYILPNLFTGLSLLCGFYAVLAAVDSRFIPAAWAIILSGLFDGLDGTVARLTNTASKIGVQLDSLCDLIAFGMAPTVMVYFWALTPECLIDLQVFWQKFGAVAAFIYLACGTFRLARFNVMTGLRDPSFFQGLPISAGAVALAAAVILSGEQGVLGPPETHWVLVLTVVLGLLMVSSLNYVSHKNNTLCRRFALHIKILILVIIVLSLIFGFSKVFFPAILIYLVSGPIVSVVRWRKA